VILSCVGVGKIFFEPINMYSTQAWIRIRTSHQWIVTIRVVESGYNECNYRRNKNHRFVFVPIYRMTLTAQLTSYEFVFVSTTIPMGLLSNVFFIQKYCHYQLENPNQHSKT
jgi:hypothetical protein